MQKLFLIIAAIYGALAVGLGAFGAHAFKNMLETSHRAETYETAVKYHFWHTLALIAVALLIEKFNTNYLQISGWAFIIGIAIFSGSLYALCFTGINKLGAITPIGGLSLILGWIMLAIAVIRG